MNKIKIILSGVIPFLCALGIQIVTVILFSIFMEIETLSTSSEALNEASYEFLLMVSALSAIICVIVFGIWYKKIDKGFKNAKLKDVNRAEILGYIFLLGIGLQMGIAGVVNLISSIKPEWFNAYDEVINTLGMGNSLISTVYIAIIAPISEEIIFRGVIMEKFRKNMTFFKANILQALLFGIYHMNIVQGTYAFIMGLFAGLVYYKLKSLYAVILLHMIINISGLLLEFIPSNSSIVIIAYAILSILSYGLIYKGYRYFYNFKYTKELSDELKLN